MAGPMLLQFNTNYSIFITIIFLIIHAKLTKQINSTSVDHLLPYVVVVTTQYGRLCTGSAIGYKWVITAAHCYIQLDMYIQLNNYAQPPWKILNKPKVLKIYLHPNYIRKTFITTDKGYLFNYDYRAGLEDDIALFYTEKMPLGRYGFLSALDKRNLVGLDAGIAGYGYSSKYFELRKRLTDQKRPLSFNEGLIKPCKKKYILCVACKCSNIRRVPLGADDGAPLFVYERIVGVLSIIEDYNDRITMLYTGVSHYLEWIDRVIKQDGKANESFGWLESAEAIRREENATLLNYYSTIPEP